MKSLTRTLVAVIALTVLGIGTAVAVLPNEVLDDPALETRARAISKNLRCLVCQNQSIDDSNADLARDLRVIVRQRLVVGDSDDQVTQYIVDRYGDYVLLKPPLNVPTFALWFGPAAILVIAGSALLIAARRRRGRQDVAGLTEDEKKRLSELLGNGANS